VAWIDLPGDEETPELARLTKPYKAKGRAVPSVVAVMKPSPNTLKTVLRMNYAVSFGGSSLGHRREELTSVAVSAISDCFY
jgi:hypothetical protein